MNKKDLTPSLESKGLSPEMLQLLEQHFWCDFSDLIPALSWDKTHPDQ